MRDLASNIRVAQALAPAARTSSATGGAVDRKGYDSLAVAVSVGAWTDGSHAVTVEHSEDGTTWEPAPAGDLAGSLPTIAAAGAASSVTTVGYVGGRRYLRAKVAVSGSPTTGAVIGVALIMGHPHSAPVS